MSPLFMKAAGVSIPLMGLPMIGQLFFLLLIFLVDLAVGQALSFENFRSPIKVQEISNRTTNGFSYPLIGNDGRIYACSGRNFYAFDGNGSIAWIVSLNYRCRLDVAPIGGERGEIFLISEDRVLRIDPSNVGTSSSAVEVFYGPESSNKGSGEIIGLAISIWYSSLFITIKNRGLFAFKLHGKLMWSAGPMLYRFGYRQGCKQNITGCYFSSAAVIDQCEGTIYISNTEGQLYSLYINSPHFKWIQDFSAIDKFFTITPGNNGHLYLVFPNKSLVIALDVSSGNILWENTIGPLSTEHCFPVVDLNGWLSIGSLDGFLYSFSPTGVVKHSLRASALDSVILVSPVLDCSGFAVFVSQTRVEAKTGQLIGEYEYISATKPIDMVFTMLIPATGTVYWTEKYPGPLSSLLSETDLRYLALDERIALALVAAAKTDDSLPCHTRRQKLTWSCSQAKPKYLSIYTGNERAILFFLLFQLAVIVVLAGFVRFCCIFWRKKKLQEHDLKTFLEKRRWLLMKKKTFNNKIMELEQKASQDIAGNEVLEELGDMVKARDGIERKLSTTYSLGRDSISSGSKSVLPLYDGKQRSYSFQSSKKASVTIFNTTSDLSSSESTSGRHGDSTSEEEMANVIEEETGTSYGGEEHEPLSRTKLYSNPFFVERHLGTSSEDERVVEPKMKARMWLKRRTLSSTN